MNMYIYIATHTYIHLFLNRHRPLSPRITYLHLYRQLVVPTPIPLSQHLHTSPLAPPPHSSLTAVLRPLLPLYSHPLPHTPHYPISPVASLRVCWQCCVMPSQPVVYVVITNKRRQICIIYASIFMLPYLCCLAWPILSSRTADGQNVAPPAVGAAPRHTLSS